MGDWGPSTDDWGSGGNAPTQWNDSATGDTWANGSDAQNNGADSFDGGDKSAGFDEGTDVNTGRAGGGGNGCFNCGEEGHNKADCPNPRVLKCHHCKEEGHTIRECPTAPPREFTGECRFCHQEGHMAKDCPEKPAEVCKNCQEEGHVAVDCKNPRKIDRGHIDEVEADVAWARIEEAVKDRDMDDVKEAVQQYIKACPELTYLDLERGLRNCDIGLFLIAMEAPNMVPTLTLMDLQGNLDKKYKVNYRFSSKPLRPSEREFWPKSDDENLARLAEAGEVVDRGLTKCSNCNELGHIAKKCPQEKREHERVVITCFNCGEQGHRTRDCTQPRIDKFACKNCGNAGHKVADCPEPRVAGPDIECRKCGENGHYSRDCPQGGGGGGGSRGCFNCGEEGHSARDCPEPRKTICRNCSQEGHTSRECTEPRDMSKVQCRNCDEFGHESRGCPKPRDYSRVQCQNCGEMGHTKVRCKKESPDDVNTVDMADNGFTNGGAQETAPGGGGDIAW